MHKVSIQKIADFVYQVTVYPDSGITTEHNVTVYPQYAQLLGAGDAIEELLRVSFDFLLEKESNSAILHEFDLPDISRYFPDYESTIRSHFASK